MQRGMLVIWYRPDERGLSFTLREGPHSSAFEHPAYPAAMEHVARCVEQLEEALQGPWRPPNLTAPRAALRELSASLSSLLPEPLLAELPGVGTDVQLRTDGPFLPWELARYRERPLWQLPGIAREVAQVEPTDLNRTGLRALLVIDPDGMQPWTRSAADDLQTLLGTRLKVDRLTGEEATSKALRARLEAHNYTLVHIATSLDSGRLWLADGYVRLAMLKDVLPVRFPPLTFLSAVSGGNLKLGAAVHWAEAFHALGSRTLVAPLWDTPSADALAYGFYQRLLQGVDAGEALRRAREELADDAWLAPHAWLMFGHPGASLPANQPETVKTLYRPHYFLALEEREIPLFRPAARDRPIFVGGPGVKPNEIELPELKNRAACLHFVDGGLRLENLGEEVRVNGLAVSDSIVLKGGEQVELGPIELKLRKADRGDRLAPAAPPAPDGRYQLVVERGLAEEERSFTLDAHLIVVGRLPECRVLLRDPGVSRQHLSLTFRDTTFYASQLGTATTILNGVPLAAEHELRHGDLLQLSESTVLRFADRTRDP